MRNATVWGSSPCWLPGFFGSALVVGFLFSVVSIGYAGQLTFTQPQLLPGDALQGPAPGMQVESDIARGGNQYLAVWSDGRSTPDNYYPFATEGTGTDIYATRLDASGNVIDIGPIAIDRSHADQREPRVAWNGENWLVIYESPVLSYYDTELRAVRVAPDGSVLDNPPIVLDAAGNWYNGDYAAAGGDGEWVVLIAESGVLSAYRVSGAGELLNPGGELVFSASGMIDFDIAFAQDEYLVVLESAFDAPRALRYTLNLQLLGVSPLPFAESVATDGTDFLVVAANGSSPLATVDAVVVNHGGAVMTPFTLYSPGGQAGTCCADVTWDGTYYWVSWGGPRLARVTPGGTVIDPGGFPVTPPADKILFPRYAPVGGGGLQMVYNHSSAGADDPKDIYTGRVSPTGQFGGVAAASRGAPAQMEADFAAGDGTHLLVFISRTSESGRILAQRIDDEGAALDPEPIEVSSGIIPGPDFAPPSLGPPAAAWNGSVFMITWSDGIQIFARRMLPDGTFLDATPLVVMDGHDPDVAAVGDVFLVVGLDLLYDIWEWQATHSMRVDGATGDNLDATPNALGGFAIFARHPHVVGWGDRWLVVWQLNLSHDNTVAGTTAAIVNADGTTPGLIDVPLGWRPDVAVSGDRALFVAVSHTIASAPNDIEGVIMLADGSFTGPAFPISEAVDKQLKPAVTWDGSHFIAAWEDKRNAAVYFDERTDIYGTRIATDGTVLDGDGVPLSNASVPELQPALLSLGNTTLMAVSTFRPETQLGALRISIQSNVAGPATGVTLPRSHAGLRLLSAHPNPANPATTIRFEYDEPLPVDVRIFDVTGRLVRTLVKGEMFDPSLAPIEVRWNGRDDDGRNVTSGVFFYEVRTPTAAASGRVVILK